MLTLLKKHVLQVADAGACIVIAMLALGTSTSSSQTRPSVRVSVLPLVEDQKVEQRWDEHHLSHGEDAGAEALQDFRLSKLEDHLIADQNDKTVSTPNVDLPAWVQGFTAVATAGFTYALVRIGRSQVSIAALQATIAERQLEAARVAEIRAHRPRLYIRSVVMQRLPTTSDAASVSVVIANRGSQQAIGIEAKCVLLFYTGSLPLDYAFEDHEVLRLDSDTLAGGNSALGWVDGSKPLPSPPIRVGGFVAWRAWCIGKVRYYDDAGTLHVTGFVRIYERRDGEARFYALDEPSYEYEE